MTGDADNFIARLKLALPTRWFPDTTPILDAVLAGLAAAWSALYSLIVAVRQESRIATMSGMFLDITSGDFFGANLPRRTTELDDAFRSRIEQALVREHATRAALTSALEELTGNTPGIFEADRVADTGAYGCPTLGYGMAGAWGSLALPFQVFVIARRAQAAGIANIAGYGTGGPLARASLSQISGQVTDADIAASVVSVLPTASTAWLRITN